MACGQELSPAPSAYPRRSLPQAQQFLYSCHKARLRCACPDGGDPLLPLQTLLCHTLSLGPQVPPCPRHSVV